MSRPLFSVVTVTLNCAEDAEHTARSVATQTFTDYEYIVKDGGSIDGTVERLRDLEKPQIYVSPDQGVYSAMNQALAACSGTYVCFLNAGDLFATPETLTSVAEAIQRHNDPTLVYGDIRSFSFHPWLSGRADVLNTARDIQYPDRLSRFYLFRRMICHQAWFVHRSAYERHHGFDERYKLLADYAFLLDVLITEKARYCHVPMITAVFQGGGLSERNAAVTASERQAIQRRVFGRLERWLYSTAYSSAHVLIQEILYRQVYPRLSSRARRRLNGW